MARTEFATARAAAARAPAGARAFLGGCTAEPLAILAAVADDPALWQDIRLTGAFVPGVNDRDFTTLGTRTRVETIFATPGLRGGAAVDHLPLHYSAYWQHLSRPGQVDVAFVTVPPPGADWCIGLGLTCDFAPAVIAAGAVLVGVVNPGMPDIATAPRYPVSRFAALVDGPGALPAYDAGRVDPASARIADHVLGLLRPGDTLQLGLGRVQAAVLAALPASGLRNLGFHGGMISAPIRSALDQGLFSRGVTTGVALGDAGFYADLPRHARIRFQPVGVTHAQATLAAIPRLIAVNTVIEIDLSGQANAEARGGRQVSGQGGLVDFLRGARASAGGRSVLALPATAQGGRISRIVAALDAGTPVSVARADVDMVVTEHGVADLADQPLARRAERLIAIAAPAFRDALSAGWDGLQRGPGPVR